MLRLTALALTWAVVVGAALPDSLCIMEGPDGRSMEPTLHAGQCYAIRDTTGGVQRGDIVWLPHFHNLVKRITAVEGDTVAGHIIKPGRVWIHADGGGMDSRRIGTVPRRDIRAIIVVPQSQQQQE